MKKTEDQYDQFLQQSQDALHKAVDSWADTMRGTLAAVPTAAREIDPKSVLDQGFDFAEKVLAMQHDYTKALVEKASAVAQAVPNVYGDQGTDAK